MIKRSELYENLGLGLYDVHWTLYVVHCKDLIFDNIDKFNVGFKKKFDFSTSMVGFYSKCMLYGQIQK